MVQLILTVIAIALTAALVLATVNYTPWWASGVADTEAGLRDGIRRLTTSYQAAAQAAGEAALNPLLESDGGLRTRYQSYLGFLPYAPTGYQWIYGQGGAEPAYAGLRYFCLLPTPSAKADERVVRAMQRLSNGFSSEQVVIGSGCGLTPSGASLAASPPYMTVWVKALPVVGS